MKQVLIIFRRHLCPCCRDGTYNSLLSMVSEAGGEYSFFSNMKNMWAGPGHWKARRQAAPGKHPHSASPHSPSFLAVNQAWVEFDPLCRAWNYMFCFSSYTVVASRITFRNVNFCRIQGGKACASSLLSDCHHDIWRLFVSDILTKTWSTQPNHLLGIIIQFLLQNIFL